MPEEWSSFDFNIAPNSSELTTVRHVAHVPHARRIIEDGRIKAGLVYDESRLNTSRISVAWVSANTWGPGSIYGTVEFQFKWNDLIASRKIYWVEAMQNYKPPAYRFLLSKRDILPGLIKPYDPAKENGPLKLKDNVYHWNGNRTSEFMIDDDLTLDRCTGIDFIIHNSNICSSFGNQCADRMQQPSPQRTGGRILSFVLGCSSHKLDGHFRPEGATPGFAPLDIAYSGLQFFLPSQVKFSGTMNADAECENILMGALALYGNDQAPTAKKLLASIASRQKFDGALKSIVRQHFSDPDWEPSG